MPLHHISTQDSIRRLKERTEIRNSRKEVRWKIGENKARLHPLSSSAESDVRHCHPCGLNIVKTLGIRCQTEGDRADYFRKDMYHLNLKLDTLPVHVFSSSWSRTPKAKFLKPWLPFSHSKSPLWARAHETYSKKIWWDLEEKLQPLWVSEVWWAPPPGIVRLLQIQHGSSQSLISWLTTFPSNCSNISLFGGDRGCVKGLAKPSAVFYVLLSLITFVYEEVDALMYVMLTYEIWEKDNCKVPHAAWFTFAQKERWGLFRKLVP